MDFRNLSLVGVVTLCGEEGYGDSKYCYELRVEGCGPRMVAVVKDDALLSLVGMLGSSRELSLYMDTEHDHFRVACEKQLLE